jgi:hypothetical protein
MRQSERRATCCLRVPLCKTERRRKQSWTGRALDLMQPVRLAWWEDGSETDSL